MNGIHPTHLQLHVIRPTLKRMNKWSPSAENLLLGTAAQESNMGRYLKQHGIGPAVGIMQIEPTTAADIIHRYLNRRAKVEEDFEKGFQIVNTADIDWQQISLADIIIKLQTDLAFSVAVARMKYAMVPEPLPPADDIWALAHYWKKYYNTEQGKGTPEDFVMSWERCHFGVKHD